MLIIFAVIDFIVFVLLMPFRFFYFVFFYFTDFIFAYACVTYSLYFNKLLTYPAGVSRQLNHFLQKKFFTYSLIVYVLTSKACVQSREHSPVSQSLLASSRVRMINGC